LTIRTARLLLSQYHHAPTPKLIVVALAQKTSRHLFVAASNVRPLAENPFDVSTLFAVACAREKHEPRVNPCVVCLQNEISSEVAVLNTDSCCAEKMADDDPVMAAIAKQKKERGAFESNYQTKKGITLQESMKVDGCARAARQLNASFRKSRTSHEQALGLQLHLALCHGQPRLAKAMMATAAATRRPLAMRARGQINVIS
jgi:hypothetical protein